VKLLLDTHAFLWSIMGEKMSQRAEAAFLDTDNELYLSAASYWEICIKQNIGRLELADDWPKAFDREMLANGIKWLPIEKQHCRGIAELPPHHRDPFDRLLIAQTRCEGMTLLTADNNIRQYDIPAIW
jgi:PIN domain nuclease of toxin-antitoxin system